MKPEHAVEYERLWTTLGEQGPVPAFAAGPVWYLSLMLGLAAWFSGVLGMLVTGLIWNLSGSGAFLPLALLWGVPGLLLLRVQGMGTFPWQLGLSLLIAGECAAVAAIGLAFERPEPTLFASALLFVGVAALAPRPAAQVLNVLAACAAWVLCLRWSMLGEPWHLWSDASRPPLAMAVFTWLACWAPLIATLLSIVRSEARWMATPWAGLLRSAIIGLIVALAFATPLADPLSGFVWRDSDGSRDWMALWPLLSLAAGVVATAVAFHQRLRVLLAVCLFGLLLHVGHFYYALGISLLAKSVVMLLMGAGLLGLAWAVREGKV